MMIYKLSYFLTIAVLATTTPWGGATYLKATKPMPAPLPVIQLMQPLPPTQMTEMQPMELASFPLAPMGTYANTYTPANCTWGVASMKASIPGNWGNANTWDDMARAEGKTVSDVPIVGAVAQRDGGEFGHVAAVLQVEPGRVLIEEMNYDYNGGVRTRWADVSEFVYIYI